MEAKRIARSIIPQQMDPASYPRIPHPGANSTNSDNASTATTTAAPPLSSSNFHGTSATAARRTKPPTTWAHISAAVLESLRDLHYVLSLAGVVEHVSPNSAALLGYSPEQLVGIVLADHVHEDDTPVYKDELRESSSTGRQFRFYCRIRSRTAVTMSDTDVRALLSRHDEKFQDPSPSPSYSIFEIIGRFHQNTRPEPVPVGIGLVATPPSEDGIFVLMARPYPLTQSTRLDSFLSLKIENARLTAQLAALKDEQEDESQRNEQDPDYPEREQHSMAAPNFSTATFRRPSDGFPWFDATPSTLGLTTGSGSSAQESVFSSGSSSTFGPASSNSTNSNMSSRPLSASAIKPSPPLSAGQALTNTIPATSKSPTNTPTVMEGDVGIPFIVKALTGAAGIKKRAKHVEDYVCAWCNTTNSPEWRKGPGGPKSLCNACGLRYAKARRKSTAPGSSGNGGGGSDSGRGPATGPDSGGNASASAAGPKTAVGPVVA